MSANDSGMMEQQQEVGLSEPVRGSASPMMVDEPVVPPRVSALDVARVKERFAQIERQVMVPPPQPQPQPPPTEDAEDCSQMSAGPMRDPEAQYPTQAEKEEADKRSVYVGNVDYSTTADELEDFFKDCGGITRVTIMCDRFSGNPKGFAYVEFAQIESVTSAIALSDSLFKDRNLKICQKRTNMPGRSGGTRGRRRFGGGRFGLSSSSYYRGSRFPRRGRWAYYYPY